MKGRWVLTRDVIAEGTRVRVIDRQAQRVVVVGLFVAAGEVKGGPADGARALDIVPELDVPGVDDDARQQARTWHELNDAGDRRYWAWNGGDVIHVWKETP